MTDETNAADFKNEANRLVVRKTLLMTRLGLGRIGSAADEWRKTNDEIAAIDGRMKEMRSMLERGE